MDSMDPRSALAFEIVPVWKAIGPELGRELVEMWGRTRAIANSFTAVSRSSQAVCIARDDTGVIRAVGTAVLRVLPRLQEPMYYYRQYFDPAIRGQGQSVAFYNRAREVLAAYNASLPTPESLGVLLEVENSWLAEHYAVAKIEEADSVFLGYSPRGLQLRASYFEGARLTAKPYVRQPRREG